MRTLIICIFIWLSNLALIINNEEIGTEIIVNQKVVENIKNKFIPRLINLANNMTIGDQSLDINILLGKAHLDIKDIKFKIHNFLAENFQIYFNETNRININLKDASAEGKMNLNFSYIKIFKGNLKIEIGVSNFNFNSVFEIISQESKVDKGKFLPSLKVDSLFIDFNLDLKIEGSFWGKLINTFKKQITSAVKKMIISQVKNLINENIKKYIIDFIPNQSAYYHINNTEFDLDYSLISPVRIESNSIHLNSFLALVNKNLNSTLNPEYINITQTESLLPDKSVIGMLSINPLDQALSTLFKSQFLKFTITTEDSEKLDLPVKLNTTLLDVFFDGLSNTNNYGKDAKVKFECEVISLPVIKLTNNRLNSNLTMECLLQVKTGEKFKNFKNFEDFENFNEEIYDDAIKFSFNLNLDGGVKLLPQGQIQVNIRYFGFDSSTIIDSKVRKAEISYVEQFLDFASQIAVPYLNNKLFSSYKINLPKIYGISFEDSVASIEEDLLILGVNPVISDAFVDYIISILQNSTTSVDSRFKREAKIIYLKECLRFLQ